METQFEKLEELIKDDDKIVTVVSLAQIAKISLQESQILINKYVELHKESGEIHPTYILNGLKKKTGDLWIVQVNDDNIEAVKRIYKPEPEVIIFSIQKAKSIDYNVISLVQPKIENCLPGQIIGKNCVRRVLTKKILPTLPAPTVKGKSMIFTKQPSAVKSEEKIKVEDKNDIKSKAPVQGSIASMFKGAPNKKAVEQKPKKNVGLSNFLTKKVVEDTKQPKKEAEETKHPIKEEIKPKSHEKEEPKKPKKEEIKSKSNKKEETKKPKKEAEEIKSKPNKSSCDLFDSDTDEEILKDLKMQEEKPKPKKPTPKNKRKKTQESSSTEKSAKKRKRIIVEDSDSSDDIFANEKSDNEEPELMEIEKPEPVKEAPVPKNKRRKAVKKMYEDDEGFIVTETEYVYETASEDEQVPEAKVKPLVEKKSNSEAKISPTKAKKGAKKAVAANQPTLMNFFKKK